MGIAIDKLTSLDPEAVRQARETIAEQVQEENPSIYIKQGVLHDYLAHYGGIFAAKNQAEMDRLRRSMTINEIIADPTLADEETVNNAASNFGVARLAGSTARGSVTVVVDILATVTIAAGAEFQANNQFFVSESSFTARISSDLATSATDRVLMPRGDGTYSFQITVKASQEGIAGKLTKDTLLVATNPPLNYLTSYASEDFVDGLNQESNSQLAQRFVYGVAAKAFSGRDNMSAAVREQAAFENVLQDSLIGMGDAEMLRDQHSIFPGSTGGKVDWYVRSQAMAQKTGTTKTATLVQKTGDGYGIWQIHFDRDDAAGMYDVFNVRPLNSPNLGGYQITEDIRTPDLSSLTNDGFLPDAINSNEVAYSRFQSVIVRFKDTDTIASSLTEQSSTQDYSITYRWMPLIAELQEYVSKRRTRNTMGDALIKAPVPCFITLSLSIIIEPGQETPDTAAIAQALADAVNAVGFTGRLPASILADTAHNNLVAGASLSAIDIFGKIRRPDGTIKPIRSTELLEVPYEPQNMVTSRTVAFLLEPSDVTISVITADITEV